MPEEQQTLEEFEEEIEADTSDDETGTNVSDNVERDD